MIIIDPKLLTFEGELEAHEYSILKGKWILLIHGEMEVYTFC
jgi:hypothetical protein